jgi:hypothetical protein
VSLRKRDGRPAQDNCRFVELDSRVSLSGLGEVGEALLSWPMLLAEGYLPLRAIRACPIPTCSCTVRRPRRGLITAQVDLIGKPPTSRNEERKGWPVALLHPGTRSQWMDFWSRVA